MNETIFYQIFNDFLIKNEISPSSNFESVKKEWIPFLHTNDNDIQECICGHKVKHINYYFNLIHKTVMFIGTSCCKKYGFSQKTMENDIFIHVLREQINQSFYEKKGNLLVLTKNLEILLEQYIFEKFQLFTGKYIETIDKNTYYFDIYKPLEKMKNDIFELINKYGYHLHKYYDEINDYLIEREMIMNEKYYFESNNMEDLEIIKKSIFQSFNQENATMNVNSYIIQDNENDFIQQDILEEKELQQNLEIEKIIKNELKNDYEENEAIYYLENENFEEFRPLNMYNDKHEKSPLDIQTQLLPLTSNVLKYKQKIQTLENQIFCLKHDLSRFNENVRIFKNNINYLMRMMDICNRICKIKDEFS